jgi:hypothetical protein
MRVSAIHLKNPFIATNGELHRNYVDSALFKEREKLE